MTPLRAAPIDAVAAVAAREGVATARAVVTGAGRCGGALLPSPTLRAAPAEVAPAKPAGYFPYGKSNFLQIRSKGNFYVDKTEFIEAFEELDSFGVFCRPARMGKTLLVDVLEKYYDKRFASRYDELFSGLYIHGRPIASSGMRGKYHVMRFALSFDATPEMSVEKVRVRLYLNLTRSLHRFLNSYRACYPDDSELAAFIDEMKANLCNSARDPLYVMMSIADIMSDKGHPLLILVDEYDRAADGLLFGDVRTGSIDEKFEPVYNFFMALKSVSELGVPHLRMLIVGISPVNLAEISKFNISKNLTLRDRFADACGFTEDDLMRGLGDIGVVGEEATHALAVMRTVYNGYRFPGSKTSLFNSQMSLYFLDKYQESPTFRDGVRSLDLDNVLLSALVNAELVDANLSVSSKVVHFLSNQTKPFDAEVLLPLAAGESVACKLSDSFRLRELLGEEHTLQSDRDNLFLSFLFYFGLVTTSDGTRSSVVAPNLAVRLEMLPMLVKLLKLNTEATVRFVRNPTPETLALFVANAVGQVGTYIRNEAVLQMLLEVALRVIGRVREKAHLATELEAANRLRGDILLKFGHGEVVQVELKKAPLVGNIESLVAKIEETKTQTGRWELVRGEQVRVYKKQVAVPGERAKVYTEDLAVQQWVTKACEQAKRYNDAYMTMFGANTNVRALVAVLINRRVVVSCAVTADGPIGDVNVSVAPQRPDGFADPASPPSTGAIAQ